MGEAKRKREAFEQRLLQLTEELADSGHLIMAGYAAYRDQVMPNDAGPVQVRECGLAFLAGAQHLFGSMMHFLEPGEEPTAKDEERMAKIFEEMQEITGQLAASAYPTKGSA